MRLSHLIVGVLAMGLATTVATTAAWSATKIRVSYAPAHYEELYRHIAERFMEVHPDIEVELYAAAPNYNELVQRTLRESIANRLPDVSHQGLNQIRTLADREIAVPLNRFVAAETDWESMGYTDAITSLAEFGGNIAGLPFGISVPVIYYNAGLVEKAGGDPDDLPTDWDGILALGQKIDALGEDVDGFYMEYTNNGWSFQAFVGSFGGTMMTPDETAVAFDGEEGLSAMELLQRFGQAGQPDLERNQARQAFQAGTLGILFSASSALTRHQKAAEGRFTVRVGPFPTSSPDALFPSGGNGVVMLAQDPEKQEAAWEYIKYVTGPEGQAIMVEQTGYTPVNTVAVNDPDTLGKFYEKNPEHRVAARSIPVMSDWFAFPGENASKIIGVIEDRVYQVVTLQKEPETALKALSKEVTALLP